MPQRSFPQSRLDILIAGFDQALRTLVDYSPAVPDAAARTAAAPRLSATDTTTSARLMRVNHAGEVCAQALYFGQALVARERRMQAVLLAAAAEEQDHQTWCRQRLAELASSPSKLNGAWFLGAFTIGVIAGLAGDRASMGFLAETERQVVAHLESHLKVLPPADESSREIVARMRNDEARHASTALREGASELPSAVRKLMKLQAKVMTTLAALW